MSTTTVSVPRPRAAAPDWAGLRAAVAGRLVQPDETGWEAARTPWIVTVAQQPAAVLEVTDADDVVAAVRWAVANGVAVTAQPNGHGARTAVDGALLLRTRALDGITVDTVRRTATVGAGVKWGELLERLDGTGLTGLAGSSPDPTVVGLTLGGGVSWFSRAYGLTANSVVSLDVVDPTGQLVHVTRASDPDLFWALRGGGGDFGIVVAIEIALHPAPQLYGGRLLWPVSQAAPVLRAFRDLALVAPRELTVWAHIYHFPPLPEVPEPVRGRSFVSVAATYLGPRHVAEALLWTLREVAAPEIDTMSALPLSRLGTVVDEPTEPMPAMEHSMLLDGLDDDTIDRLVEAAGDPARCPLPVVQIRGLGGAFADAHPSHGAAGHVTAPFQLFALGVPAVPELAAAIPHAFAALDDVFAPVRSGRMMPNFVGEGQDTTAGYDTATLERLRAIKRARDPEGTIRSNKPVLAG